MSTDLHVVGLGRMAYETAWDIQRAAAKARIEGRISDDLLLLVEHPPVITLGRGSHDQHVVADRAELAARGITVHEIDRGGDVTFHGPGQLVGYPIFKLTEHKEDLHWFLRGIEEALIQTLSSFGIVGTRKDGYTGVWIENRKIASIGIHVKQWVTWHGFALNVTTDLNYFDTIVPCGIENVTMTSIQHELGMMTPRDLWGQTCDYVMLSFAEVFGFTPQAMALGELEEKVTSR